MADYHAQNGIAEAVQRYGSVAAWGSARAKEAHAKGVHFSRVTVFEDDGMAVFEAFVNHPGMYWPDAVLHLTSATETQEPGK
jgi:hypothetical protein